MGIETIVGLGLGAAGLLQNSNAQRKQNQLQNKALSLEEQKAAREQAAFDEAMRLYQNYDPVREAQPLIDNASKQTQATIEKALRKFNTQYLTGGGTPGQTSLFNARAQGITDRAADPLRAYIAEVTANPTMKKVQMLMSALGAAPTGSLSQAYWKAADRAPSADYTPSIQMLAQVLQSLQSRGAGGRGDYVPQKPTSPNIV